MKHKNLKSQFVVAMVLSLVLASGTAIAQNPPAPPASVTLGNGSSYVPPTPKGNTGDVNANSDRDQPVSPVAVIKPTDKGSTGLNNPGPSAVIPAVVPAKPAVVPTTHVKGSTGAANPGLDNALAPPPTQNSAPNDPSFNVGSGSPNSPDRVKPIDPLVNKPVQVQPADPASPTADHGNNPLFPVNAAPPPAGAHSVTAVRGAQVIDPNKDESQDPNAKKLAKKKVKAAATPAKSKQASKKGKLSHQPSAQTKNVSAQPEPVAVADTQTGALSAAMGPRVGAAGGIPAIEKPISCQEQAMQAVYHLVQKDDQNILGRMFEVTAMRLALRAVRDESSTLEETMKKDLKTMKAAVNLLPKSEAFQKELVKTYNTYGKTADLDAIQNDFKASLKKGQDACYWSRNSRLQNEHSSAFVLALSLTDQGPKEEDHDSYLSDIDAGTIWAVNSIKKAAAYGNETRENDRLDNLMNISTRVARYLGKIEGQQSASQEDLYRDIAAEEKKIQDAFDSALTKGKDELRKDLYACYKTEVKNLNCDSCTTKDVDSFVNSLDTKTLQRGLLASVNRENTVKMEKELSGQIGKVGFNLMSTIVPGNVKKKEFGKYGGCGQLNPNWKPTRKPARAQHGNKLSAPVKAAPAVSAEAETASEAIETAAETTAPSVENRGPADAKPAVKVEAQPAVKPAAAVAVPVNAVENSIDPRS